jgi:hypothetical protein
VTAEKRPSKGTTPSTEGVLHFDERGKPVKPVKMNSAEAGEYLKRLNDWMGESTTSQPLHTVEG